MAISSAPVQIGGARLRFADIAAPIGTGEFLSRYWTREGVLLRTAERDFGRFLNWDAVNAILNAGDFAFPAIKMSRRDSPLPTEQYTTNIGGRQVVDSRAVVEGFRDGASFGITGADSHWPPLREVLDCFHDALLESVNANVYCSPANTQGFQCHYDLHEVFVLQIEGTKHWRVFRPFTEAPVEGWTREGAEEALQTEPYIDVVLRKGDVLYVPRGHWHYAVAEDNVSLHVTVGVSCRRGLQFLDWLGTELLQETVWRKNAPLLRSETGDGSAVLRSSRTIEWSRELRTSLVERLSDPTLFERFLRDTIRGIRPLHNVDLVTQGAPELPALDRIVFERPPGRPYLLDEQSPGEVVVSVSGMDIQLEGIKAAVLDRIFSSPSFTLADVRGWDSELNIAEISELLTELVRGGLLLIRPS